MYIVIIITAVVVLVAIRLLYVFSDKIKFFSTGLDNGFKFSEISLLWKLAKVCELEEPVALYWSVPALNRSISQIISDSRRTGTENTDKVQSFLSKLYKYRTKIDIESDKKKGLDSTKYLDKGQRLRIIFPGHGVFTSEILNNGHEIIIKTPVQKNIIKVEGKDWISHPVSVYLWRKGDANYVFDTVVTNSGVFNGNSVIYLAETDKLLRAQKRKSVRCQCNLFASLYFIKSEVTDYNMVETAPGYRCLLEDISEDGALVRVGGKGRTNVQIKLQFQIGETFIIMFGVIRAVEYNKTLNQSRLHFECIHLEKEMKNTILSYVYNVLPQDQKDVFDALSQTEADAEEDPNAPDEESDQSLLENQSSVSNDEHAENSSTNSSQDTDSDISKSAHTSPEDSQYTMSLPKIKATEEDLENLSELPVNDDDKQK